ncbi:sensor histidine kinase [Gymnodinialimonas ulvae]|uniref:sensor histidine kinase n=1 Tax=Gymnodinialimonas ulvae TaxID=3126504 RepID=UPI0030AEC344
MRTLQYFLPDRQPDDLDRLWKSEFGRPSELVLRYCAIASAGVGLWAYSGMLYGIVWMLGYFLFQSILGMYLRRAERPPTARQHHIAAVLFHLTAIAFAWMPIYLLTTGDNTLVFCGVLAIGALSVFNVWRDEPPTFVFHADLAMGWLALIVGLATYVPQTEGVAAQVVMVIIAGAFIGYYTMALATTRQHRRMLRDAMARGVETQKMEAMGRLSGGIAHDFNNLLTVIRGNLDLYSEMQNDRQRTEVIAEASRAVDRATGLVSQLLVFARRAPLTTEEFEIGAAVSDIMVMAQRVLPETITIREETPAGLVFAQLDPARFNSALLNLVLNARDAMDGRGKIVVSVRLCPGAAAERDDTQGPHVRVAVSDTGPGMSPEVLERAFEPFFTTKPVGAGSGLGLPMVKGFAEQSGGRISLDTGADGTTIAMHVPLHKRAAPAAAAPQQHQSEGHRLQ